MLLINFAVMDRILKAIQKTPEQFLIWLDNAYATGDNTPCTTHKKVSEIRFLIMPGYVSSFPKILFCPNRRIYIKDALIEGYYYLGDLWNRIIDQEIEYTPLRDQFIKHYKLDEEKQSWFMRFLKRKGK